MKLLNEKALTPLFLMTYNQIGTGSISQSLEPVPKSQKMEPVPLNEWERKL